MKRKISVGGGGSCQKVLVDPSQELLRASRLSNRLYQRYHPTRPSMRGGLREATTQCHAPPIARPKIAGTARCIRAGTATGGPRRARHWAIFGRIPENHAAPSAAKPVFTGFVMVGPADGQSWGPWSSRYRNVIARRGTPSQNPSYRASGGGVRTIIC